MALDLPISDVKEYVESFMQQIGIDCTIDGIPTKVMLSDVSTYYNLHENMKQAVLLRDIPVRRGSKIITQNGVSLVYTMPNDDLVSWSVKILMCNATLELIRQDIVYDEDTGDIISDSGSSANMIDGFIERAGALDKIYDLGIINEYAMKLTICSDTDVCVNDRIRYRNRLYRVIDINDMTGGLLLLLLGYAA